MMALKEDKKADNKSKKGIVKFVKEVKSETKRITWPPKSEVKKSTIVVLFFCAVCAVIIGFMDYGFSLLSRLIFTK